MFFLFIIVYPKRTVNRKIAQFRGDGCSSWTWLSIEIDVCCASIARFLSFAQPTLPKVVLNSMVKIGYAQLPCSYDHESNKKLCNYIRFRLFCTTFVVYFYHLTINAYIIRVAIAKSCASL